LSRKSGGQAKAVAPGKWPAAKLEHWPIGKIKKDPNNARTHSAEQIAAIAKSMAEFGWTMPCLVRENGQLIAGEGRWLAGKKLGFTEAPVLVARGWTDKQCRAYALADNQIATKSGWDEDILEKELSALQGEGFDLDDLGFSQEDVEEILGGLDHKDGRDTDVDRADRLEGHSGEADDDDATTEGAAPAAPAAPAKAKPMTVALYLELPSPALRKFREIREKRGAKTDSELVMMLVQECGDGD
jgi:ParB-like chromosome segregation protein Spo0J